MWWVARLFPPKGKERSPRRKSDVPSAACAGARQAQGKKHTHTECEGARPLKCHCVPAARARGLCPRPRCPPHHVRECRFRWRHPQPRVLPRHVADDRLALHHVQPVDHQHGHLSHGERRGSALGSSDRADRVYFDFLDVNGQTNRSFCATSARARLAEQELPVALEPIEVVGALKAATGAEMLERCLRGGKDPPALLGSAPTWVRVMHDMLWVPFCFLWCFLRVQRYGGRAEGDRGLCQSEHPYPCGTEQVVGLPLKYTSVAFSAAICIMRALLAVLSVRARVKCTLFLLPMKCRDAGWAMHCAMSGMGNARRHCQAVTSTRRTLCA